MLALIGAGELLLLAYVTVLIPFVIGCFLLWILSLIHCLRNKTLTDSSRIVWVVVICLTHAIGACLYLLFGRPGDRPLAATALR